MEDFSEIAAFLSAMGGQAQVKRKPALAPGGPSGGRPAPSKFRSQDGVSDSQFVQQVIQAAQQMQGGMGGLLTTGAGPMQPPMMGGQAPPQMGPQMGGATAGGGGGLAGILQMIGGGGQ